MDSMDVTSPANASPPDFDFNLPCRFFKSSFARSLSLNSGSMAGTSSNQCKSLDYDRSGSSSSNNNNKQNNSLFKNENNSSDDMLNTIKTTGGILKCDGHQPPPPVPQKPGASAASPNGTLTFSTSTKSAKNEATNEPVDDQQNQDHMAKKDGRIKDKPPALPARKPTTLSIHSPTSMGSIQQQQQQQKMQASLTHLRQQAFNQALSQSANANTAVMPVNAVAAAAVAAGSKASNQQQFNQNIVNHQPVTASRSGNSNSNDSISSSSSAGSNNNNPKFRRNDIVWPNQSTKQNVEQDFNFYDTDNDDDIHFQYHDTMKLANPSDSMTTASNQSQRQPPSHLAIPTIITTNLTNNQFQQQHQHQHQKNPYDIVQDNTTNVEAIILQNQVDTLHWQLKQVETNCDMYRAVMEEVARFLERYQKQRQLQQQQQQQQHQKEEQKLAGQKFNNIEQISRSKSLYQVNESGGSVEKSSLLVDNSSGSTSSSYLRVRSSTNLIDLKQCGDNVANKLTNAKGRHSKDDHNFDMGLTPSQSYSAFKDFTWRRSPKKSTDSRSLNGREDVDEKLNQEAFRLLRTIQNLLNTSQQQSNITHQSVLYQRHSMAASGSRISKALSTCSVATLPGVPMHNSTILTNNCGASTTSTDSSISSPTIAVTPNTLAPADMLFLRSTNIRDSRLSLRSSTDSSVHSASSSTSTASSKVETDDEPITQFHSQPNVLGQHKPSSHNHHHHIAGSSTEDESGFSSISSFPDVGVPFNSTFLSAKDKDRTTKGNGPTSQKAFDNDKEPLLLTPEGRNSTLKANVVGIPLNSIQDMSHRWDSPSKTYHNASSKFQKFSALANTEDTNTVLWV
ncbi:uncharacterized protein LOC142233848 [Haematobia irritans]|uniref:uncharacterized protein LOC142233848 n=1 Tax=Haematobia irritans TaxID=7368 RepID=UPI003F50B31F